MESIELMSIYLETGNEVVLDLLYTVPIVLCDVGGHAITQHITRWIIKNLSYNIILGMDWLESTNIVIDSVACSLELTVDAQLYTLLAFPVNSVANVTLSSLKYLLAEIKCSCS